ncbi:hypothetical protein ACFY3G_29775 [Streptomyces phaeochromogenes]|uniref:hypothetical protein n=1 Tax=Streptomyces phaeochromogenes TaxID=1923 RepID=UPI0036C4EF59
MRARESFTECASGANDTSGDFVRAVLFTHDHELLVMPAALCTSELATNVHLHTRGAAMLRVADGRAGRYAKGVWFELRPAG